MQCSEETQETVLLCYYQYWKKLSNLIVDNLIFKQIMSILKL